MVWAIGVGVGKGGGAGKVTDGGGDGPGLVVPVLGRAVRNRDASASGEVKVNGELVIGDRAMGNLEAVKTLGGGGLGPG